MNSIIDINEFRETIKTPSDVFTELIKMTNANVNLYLAFWGLGGKVNAGSTISKPIKNNVLPIRVGIKIPEAS